MQSRTAPLLGILYAIVVCGGGLLASVSPAFAQYSFDEEPIKYNKTPARDRVARLAAKIESGGFELRADDNGDYLKAILDELDIPVSSQALVFSKTSLQVHRISPETPRAIYFNDDVYVGWVQDGYMIEFAAMDDTLGGVFYSLRLGGNSPRLTRDRGSCLACHASQRTSRVPGFFIRSVYPRVDGRTRETGTVTDHRSPLEGRWGGWYVTGTYGTLRHNGNAFAIDPDNGELINREPGANLVSLSDHVDMQPYLTAHSDVVALMVMEHQMQMQNYITLMNYETRKAIASDHEKTSDLQSGELSAEAQDRIAAAGDNLVEYMLFCDEPAIPSPVTGTSTFTEDFSTRGPFDSKRRSLRQFDLEHRLFRYPCSYLIYSSAFDSLPKQAAEYVRDRVLKILRGEEKSERFSHLSDEDRLAILEILTQTKPDWF